ncbi:tail completion protein [Escherichia phage DT57C]|uniref:Tail completion protein n=2 Tax=Tequintavirus TaxID=187218 RepID=A0A0A7RSW8_9CAUD|nr:tail completion or Neck1 protein [Escherichia phage DT57C]YP_009784971.1 tail completion or Neck1 protein [Escherichia phage DT571/2]AJA41639.1 tail completion protein [Escherichia phage DT57C]AJA41772.1 tail completion protein [Escherichia phage DT571/2]
MSLSDLATRIIKEQLDNVGRSENNKNTVVYSVETGLKDPTRDGTVAQVSFKFSKPVSQDLLSVRTASILKAVSSSLDLTGDLGALESLIQSTAGKKSSVGKKRSTGRVQVNFGDPSDVEDGYSGAVSGASGRFVSNSNMKVILELVAKEYLIKDMKKAGAPLKFRTGRFANSLKVKDVMLRDAGTSKGAPELNVTYNYMVRPYSVFNPAVSTYRRLSLRPYPGARNPQRLIGEAIAKAARDLIHSRYKIKVNQGT